jgi:2,4-dienoyl-CoA reductase-like NADH-dependent reductase (Old Yellow Enzyme family)
MTISLSDPLSLPCGAVLPNRLSKAAMTEGMASPDGVPTAELERLYGLWADGGAGMLLSGNIQIDRDHLERPGNVVIDRPASEEMKTALQNWAQAATRNGNHFWAQISHAGRQTQSNVNKHPKAPSAVKLGLPGGQFGEPVALTVEEIEELVDRFALAAKTCQDAGFTGAQIHAAHGYLLSSFLSPRSNQRTDEYGGSL